MCSLFVHYRIAEKFCEVYIARFSQFGGIHETLFAKIFTYRKFQYCPLIQCSGVIMALLKYFSVQSKSLPDPNGPLSSKVQPQAIESANKKVSALLAFDSSPKDDGSGPSRGPYMKFSPEQKAQVARYAMESGNKQAIVRYSKQWGDDLKESTVRTWKSKYEEEQRKRKPTEPLPIKALPNRKQGRPLLLGEELHSSESLR